MTFSGTPGGTHHVDDGALVRHVRLLHFDEGEASDRVARLHARLQLVLDGILPGVLGGVLDVADGVAEFGQLLVIGGLDFLGERVSSASDTSASVPVISARSVSDCASVVVSSFWLIAFVYMALLHIKAPKESYCFAEQNNAFNTMGIFRIDTWNPTPTTPTEPSNTATKNTHSSAATSRNAGPQSPTPRDEWNSADGHRVHPVPLEDTEIVRPDDLIATEDGYTRVFEQIMALDSYIDWGHTSHYRLVEYHNLEVKTCNGEFVYTFDPSRDLTQSDVPSDLASLIDFSSEQIGSGHESRIDCV